MRNLKIEELGQVYGAGGVGIKGATADGRRNNTGRTGRNSRRSRSRSRNTD